MSVIFMDSFQHYATADITKKWSTMSNVSIAAASGRRGGNAANFAMSAYLSQVLTAAYSGLIVGFALKPIASPSGNLPIVSLRDASSEQVTIIYLSDGTVKAVRGPASGVVLSSSAPGAIPPGVWSYVEVSAIIHDTAGAVTVKVNGTTVLTVTGVDTQDTANAYSTVVYFYTLNNQTYLLNDLYLLDPGTAPNTTFLGDVRVDAYYPTADGASSQWTPTPSGAHYANVDETAPNGTDYIEADIAGYVDLFQAQDLAVTPGAFFAVQLCAAALKTDAGSRQIKGVVRRSLVNYASVGKDVSDTQKYVLNQWNTDPSTAAAWTKAGFDAAEFGVELV
ncbi:MAG: hypothetical protein ROZ09_11695 [Thiobacillus sp.]|uniref:hypothetical protein n=1 Tax=Thiobacillus sp. TaxID=924 RepID=UPI002894F3E5|nr:hypothetical protein [Thiobacillus sp.]MDT3707483.1 hypothetical protein [Thiobacillus sp.]